MKMALLSTKSSRLPSQSRSARNYAASGVHGVAGLGWQPERAKIEQSVRDFNKAYNAKHEELAGLLQVALKDIGQCEARHFKVADWYDRYGFMHYTFMVDRYRQ